MVGAATLGILVDRNRDRELHIRSQQLLDERTLTEFESLVRSGVEQGVLRADVDVDMLFQLLIGTAFYTAQVQRHGDVGTSDEIAERLCSLVIRGAGKTKVRNK